jgi:5-methyltetrahydrofolate--homocysteine methyltransferase
MADVADKLRDAIVEMREDEALALTKTFVAAGGKAEEVLEICRQALEVVGNRFEKGEYFLPELVLAGEMLREISEIVKPLLATKGTGQAKSAGTVVIGTVRGDLHDIGKNIVCFMLEVNGYKVVDLGIDVPVEKFVDTVREVDPPVLGLSGFLTLAFDAMKETVEALAEAGLRDKLKVMIGGGQIDDAVRAYTGADAFGRNAMAAVILCRQWIQPTSDRAAAQPA